MTLEELELRLKAILPKQYQECYEEVQPVSMGSAGLVYGPDGQVAWDKIWGSFCDLAMAGGPPHKGTLLQPGTPGEVEAEPGRYAEVVAEICRGIQLVTDLKAAASGPGWVRVECESPAMAEWLVRAVVMENISARWDGAAIEVPAGPAYRVEKEIKNVITSIAKTSHYWVEHMWSAQQREIARLFTVMAGELALVQPALGGGVTPNERLGERIRQQTGLEPSERQYPGWFGVRCPDVKSALWMMRAMVVSNILARREETTLLLAMNPAQDPEGESALRVFVRVHGFAKARNVL